MILLVSVLVCLVSCGKGKENNEKIVDIFDAVEEAFVTDKGYTDKVSMHMSEEVFNKVNVYNTYAVNSPEYKKPYEIHLILREELQEKKDKDTVSVNMIYTVEITDTEGEKVGGSYNIPITFTVDLSKDTWCIVDKYEEA